MVFLEVLLQRVVVLEIMRLPRVSSIANEASLMLIATMLVQFVAVIETLAAESTERVSLKSRLVNCARHVVSFPHMLFQFLICKQLMLVCEHFLVTSA